MGNVTAIRKLQISKLDVNRGLLLELKQVFNNNNNNSKYAHSSIYPTQFSGPPRNIRNTDSTLVYN